MAVYIHRGEEGYSLGSIEERGRKGFSLVSIEERERKGFSLGWFGSMLPRKYLNFG